LARRRRGGSARAASRRGWRVEPLDLGGEFARDIGQLPERARDRAQCDAFKRLAEFGNGCVEALPEVERTASRCGAGAQLVGELHVASSRMRTMREAEHVSVAKRGGLLLSGVGDRAYTLGEAVIWRRLDAGLERVAPALVGELHLFERDAWIIGHGFARVGGPWS
jgi:hypothetical protein